MKRRRKLTPTTVAKIQQRRRTGASYATLAHEFDCSEGTIRNALTTQTSTASAAAPATPPLVYAPVTDPGVPLTRDELVAFLSGQARQLQADIASATDATERAAANRSLVAVQALISRTLPPAPLDPHVGVFVDAAAMNSMRDEVRRRWHEMIDMVADDSDGDGSEAP